MKIKPTEAQGLAYLMGVETAEYVIISEALKHLAESIPPQAPANYWASRIRTLARAMHQEMEQASVLRQHDVPIQDEAVRAPEGGDTVHIPPVGGRSRRGFTIRSSDGEEQDRDRRDWGTSSKARRHAGRGRMPQPGNGNLGN